MFSLLFLCILRSFKLKTEGRTIYRLPHYKVAKLKSKSLKIILTYPGLA